MLLLYLPFHEWRRGLGRHTAHPEHLLSQLHSDKNNLIIILHNTIDRDIFASKIFRLLNFCAV